MLARGLKYWIHLTAPVGLIEVQGPLRLDTVSRIREAVGKVVTAGPRVIVLDLASLLDAQELSGSVFPALGHAVATETEGELLLAAPDPAVRQAIRRAAPLFVRAFDTLSQAMEEAGRCPAGRRVIRHLPSGPHAGGDARRVVEEMCLRWRLADLCEPARLIVSELVGNAVERGKAPIELRVTVRHQVLRIEVSDAGRDVNGTPGDRLWLVAALAHNWGAVPRNRGRTVWADLLLRRVARSE